jgi:hypothetical protein
MKTWTAGAALLGCVLLSSGPALATTEFSRGQSTEAVGSNTITADSNVKYVSYTTGETINVTLDYTSTCNIVFSGLTLKVPNPFTPPKWVTGSVANVTGTPTAGAAGTSGSVSFDLTFDTLKHAGKAKDFGMVHLNLVLGVDEDCSLATGDADGLDGSTTIPVQVSVSTVSHP